MLKNYSKIWKSLMNIEFDCEVHYGNSNKYMKAKIKIIEDK